MASKIAAHIPIKAQSQRLPRKNFRDFNGQPLYHWILYTLENVDMIDEIYIDTDAEEIIKNAPERFDVEIIERPEELRGQHVSMNDILQHDAEVIQADLYVHTHCTNPLLRPSTIEDAIQIYRSQDDYDSLFSVTCHQIRAFDADGKPINHETKETERTQDVPPIFDENANIYIFSHETISQSGSRIGDDPMLYEIDAIESTEIDVFDDFQMAEYFHKKRAIEEMIRHHHKNITEF